MSGVRLTRWVPQRNAAGTRLAYFSVELASGLVINDLRLMVGRGGRHWVGMPATQQHDRDGNPRRDEAGKPVWTDIVEFRDSATRRKFQDLILEAIRTEHPEALEELPL